METCSHVEEEIKIEKEEKIKIEKEEVPIQEKIFLFFVDDARGSISKEHLLKTITKNGFLKDDPRLLIFRNKLKKLNTETLSLNEFTECIHGSLNIFVKIVQKDLIIPHFEVLMENICTIYDKTYSKNIGDVADYIPQLRNVNPDQYGVSICTIDGQRYNLGDTDIRFSVQSCCKPINYGIALEENNEEYVHTYVGREPSGQSFNEITLNKDGKPHNPLINAGAIMTTSLIKNNEPHSERFDYIINTWNRLGGGDGFITFNNSVYLSEKSTADRNYALAYFMKETNSSKKIGFPKDTKLDETLELYFQCCSIEATCNSLSIVAGTLANGGINPLTGEKIFNPDTVKNMLSMMLMCGMYDYSGEFAFKIGIPAKSGVAGAIMLVIPNVMGIVIWSPKLDNIGNSYRGVEFCKEIGKQFNFHIFDNNNNNNNKLNPTRERYIVNTNTQICEACKHGDLEYIKLLYQRGEEFNIKDYDNRTPLHIAVCENRYSIVKYLITVIKVDVTVKDRWGNTAIDDAKGSEKLKALFQ